MTLTVRNGRVYAEGRKGFAMIFVSGATADEAIKNYNKALEAVL